MRFAVLAGLPVVFGVLVGTAVAAGAPADLRAGMDALWGTTLLAMAVGGFLTPEWLLHPDQEKPGDLHPWSPRSADLLTVSAATVVGGAICGAMTATGLGDSALRLPLSVYGLLCGLALAATALSAATVAPTFALALWERGSAGRQLGATLLQTPVLTALAVGAAGLLLLIGALALMEPVRLFGGWQSGQALPRSVWLGLAVCTAPLLFSFGHSYRSWHVDARRFRIAMRTARMMLGSASGRSIAFDSIPVSPRASSMQQVVLLTLTRRLPPVRGVLVVVGALCLGGGMATTLPVLERVLAVLPLLWALVLTSWPARVEAVVDDVVAMSRLHPVTLQDDHAALKRYARAWLALRLYPGVLVPLPVLGWGNAAVGLGLVIAATTALLIVPSGRSTSRAMAVALFVLALVWAILPVLGGW